MLLRKLHNGKCDTMKHCIIAEGFRVDVLKLDFDFPLSLSLPC